MRTVEQEFDPAIPVDSVEEHPDNPRRGDRTSVGESINANGFYGAVLIQKSTRRILAGHTRLAAARAAGADTVPGIWLDVDDKQARKILMADNRTSDLAYYDDDALQRVLSAMLTEDGSLKGTGYDDATYRLVTSTDEDLYVGNVRQTPTPTERAAIYEASDIRSIILPYAGDVYDEVVDALSAIRADRGIKTNAEVILALVREAVA